jgi:hypothetical protein
MALWQCRDTACAWQGPWYACRWDGFLYLCCPACWEICDPNLADDQMSALDRLGVQCGGCLFLLLGLAVCGSLWHAPLGDPPTIATGYVIAAMLITVGILVLAIHALWHCTNRPCWECSGPCEAYLACRRKHRPPS